MKQILKSPRYAAVSQIGITWRQALEPQVRPTSWMKVKLPLKPKRAETKAVKLGGVCVWERESYKSTNMKERQRGRNPQLVTSSCNVILVRIAPSGGQILLLHHAAGGNRHMSLYSYLIFRHGATAIFTARFCIIYQYLLYTTTKPWHIFFKFTYKWKNRQVLQAVSLYSQHTSAVILIGSLNNFSIYNILFCLPLPFIIIILSFFLL